MTTKETLEAAREKISDPLKWTQGNLVDARGRNCAIGAINQALGLSNDRFCHPASDRALSALASVLPSSSASAETYKRIYRFNDSNDHACVIAAFDAAIEAAE